MLTIQYHAVAEKTLCRSLDVSSTKLNELLFMRKLDLPKIYFEINPLQILKDKSKSILQSNPKILQLHGFSHAWQAASCLHWNIVRKLQTGLDFASVNL